MKKRPSEIQPCWLAGSHQTPNIAAEMSWKVGGSATLVECSVAGSLSLMHEWRLLLLLHLPWGGGGGGVSGQTLDRDADAEWQIGMREQRAAENVYSM